MSLRKAGLWAARLAVLVLVAPALVIALYRVVPPPVTPLMLIRLVEGYGLHKDWTSLDGIAPDLQRAVIASEDGKFCQHHGFDWDALDNAVERLQSGRGRLLGGSTISMQTSKNLLLWPGRTFLRKGVEAYLTIWLEALLPKKRILELYLNVIEFGPGIYGAEAAAQRFFGIPAARLSRVQAARLAAVLPSPLEWRADAPGPYVRSRTGVIAARLGTIALGPDGPCPEQAAALMPPLSGLWRGR
ncbi:MAG: monofunctional biosynthetic peptidoglycan transglycosylase [Parvibaculaceae bacterium]|nr:monofunctional biosynthetic peptidoglycan transglycosylase [Parvibaculaceae bacterium]